MKQYEFYIENEYVVDTYNAIGKYFSIKHNTVPINNGSKTLFNISGKPNELMSLDFDLIDIYMGKYKRQV